jgi:hypothetical protein
LGPDRNRGPFCLPLKPQKIDLLCSERVTTTCVAIAQTCNKINNCREELIVHQRDIMEYQELCKENWNWVGRGPERRDKYRPVF